MDNDNQEKETSQITSLNHNDDNYSSQRFEIFVYYCSIARYFIAQLAGDVEYTDCTSVEGGGVDTPHKFLGYDTKQSDGEVPVMQELWEMWSTPEW